MLNKNTETIQQIKAYQHKYPIYFGIIMKHFCQEDLDSALKILVQNQFTYLDTPIYQKLLEILDESSLKQLINSLSQFDLQSVVNQYIISECEAKQQINQDSLVDLVYNNEIPIDDMINNEAANSLLDYFSQLKTSPALNWLMSQIDFDDHHWSKRVLASIISIGDSQAVSLLNEVIKKHKKYRFYIGANRELIQYIEKIIVRLKEKVPQGGLSLTDFDSSGRLSISEMPDGKLSLSEDQDKEFRNG